MTQFELQTWWRLPVGIEPVWEALQSVETWPRWWPYVHQVTELQPGDDSGSGAVHEFVWKTRLPYQIRFLSTACEVQRPYRLMARVEGDLKGSGCWTLVPSAVGTDVCYDWAVDPRLDWMRWLTPLARPVFAWNHAAVMARGESGLRDWLQGRDST